MKTKKGSLSGLCLMKNGKVLELRLHKSKLGAKLKDWMIALPNAARQLPLIRRKNA